MTAARHIAHERAHAVQFDFYIPAAIWDAPQIQTFLARLLAIEPGATVMGNTLGIWEGAAEQTRIFRLVFAEGRFDKNRVTVAIEQEIAQLLADLADTPAPQQTFMFTETKITRTLTSLA